MIARTAVVLWGLSSLLGATGCFARICSDASYEKQMDSAVYPLPAKQLWSRVVTLMTPPTVAGADQRAQLLSQRPVTEETWRSLLSLEEDGAVRVYQVTVEPAGAGQSRVRVLRASDATPTADCQLGCAGGAPRILDAPRYVRDVEAELTLHKILSRELGMKPDAVTASTAL
jgi:hypothetical protein